MSKTDRNKLNMIKRNDLTPFCGSPAAKPDEAKRVAKMRDQAGARPPSAGAGFGLRRISLIENFIYNLLDPSVFRFFLFRLLQPV